jgi:hypothetical protein
MPSNREETIQLAFADLSRFVRSKGFCDEFHNTMQTAVELRDVDSTVNGFHRTENNHRRPGLWIHNDVLEQSLQIFFVNQNNIRVLLFDYIETKPVLDVLFLLLYPNFHPFNLVWSIVATL